MIRWSNISKKPDLGQNEIHVWRVNLNQPVAEINLLKSYLSAEEHDRSASFHFIRDQNRFITRRAILRQLLASYLKIQVECVRISRGPNGKPFAGNYNERSKISFSCSQSADWGLIAIARDIELGVDIEHHRLLTEINHLSDACLSQSEITEFLKLPEAMKTRHFLGVWTYKEAFVKAIGKGLSFPFKDITVSNQPAKLVKVENNSKAADNWKLLTLDMGSDYSAALAYENKEATLEYFEWDFCNSKPC